MRVFVTGASGLVGSHVAERLRARGDEVVALVRPTSDPRFLAALGAELVHGDIGDASGVLASAMRGCDAVVHAAARVYGGASEADYADANVGGTQRVLDAAADAGVPRALHVSSIAVYGLVREPVGEDEWLKHDVAPRNFYAQSKRAAELHAWRVHEQGRIRVTTVRPGVVYGERDRLASIRFARMLKLRVLPLPGGGRCTIPVVYAGNVAAGILAALDREDTAGRAYCLSGDPGLTARAFFREYGRAVGRKPFVLPVPGGLMLLAGRAGDKLQPLLPGVPEFGLERAARLLLRDNPYRVDRAERELGWTAEALTPAHEAVRATAGWLQGSGGR